MQSQPPVPPWAQAIERLVHAALGHWLWFANGLVLIYGGLPLLAPLAHVAGWHALGDLIFRVYRAFCHQIPDRSFFLFGYQVAYCQRETAMYTLLFLGGLLFAVLRRTIRPAPIRVGAWLLVPMLLDGGTHLIDDIFQLGLRGSDAIGSFNFWMRMITGALFAVAVLITLYPRLERDLAAFANSGGPLVGTPDSR